MLAQGQDLKPGGWVPVLDAHVLAGRGETLAIGAERLATGSKGVPCQDVKSPVGSGFPDPRGPIPAAGGKESAVGPVRYTATIAGAG